MKRKYLWWILMGLFVLFTAVSCGTTPPEPEPVPEEVPAPPPPPPPPAYADAASLAALDAAAARAEAARQLIMDFGGPDLFPSDWASADSLFTQAQQQRRSGTTQEAQQSAARFNQAADALEELSARTLAQNFETMERALINARNAAVEVGALQLAADFLLAADNAVLGAYEKYQANDYHGAMDAAVNALAMYGAIAAGVEAFSIWEQIATAVEDFAPELLFQAEAVGLEALNYWEAGDYSSAEAVAVTTLSMFAALGAGLEAYIAWERSVDSAEELAPDALAQADAVALDAFASWEAGDFIGARAGAEQAQVMYLLAGATAERQRAMNFRGHVAVRSEFNTAQGVYNQANSAFQAQRLQEAGGLFDQSGAMFAEVAVVALERQTRAEEALRLAQERMAESDETAREAERILEGDV